MFFTKCARENCSNRSKRKYKLFLAWAYAYGAGEVAYKRCCSAECLAILEKLEA